MKKLTFQDLTIYVFIILLFASNGFASDKLVVFVSILPQKYFVQQIGKDLIDTKEMVRPGANPAIYEPKPKQMVDLLKAKIYFAIGVPFEKHWLKKIASFNPQMIISHTDHGIEKIPMQTHHDQKKHHEDNDLENREKHNHEHGSLDPHVWLSPPLVRIISKNIFNGLCKIDPVHKSSYKQNFAEFMARINKLDADIKKRFENKRKMRFIVFHPAWGYFANSYDIKQVPIEIEGKDAKASQLKEIIQYARKNEINTIFIQPQFYTKSAKLIAKAIDANIVFADPLAENWMTNLQEFANKLDRVLK